MRLMKHWNMLTREVVDIVSLQVFNVRLIESKLVFLKVCLLPAERTGLYDL